MRLHNQKKKQRNEKNLCEILSFTSIVISVSTLGPGTKELINHGDFQAEGDSILLLNGVSTNLQTKHHKEEQVIYM